MQRSWLNQRSNRRQKTHIGAAATIGVTDLHTDLVNAALGRQERRLSSGTSLYFG